MFICLYDQRADLLSYKCLGDSYCKTYHKYIEDNVVSRNRVDGKYPDSTCVFHKLEHQRSTNISRRTLITDMKAQLRYVFLLGK